MRPGFFIACVLLVGMIPAITSAATPTLINYQGKLTDGTGLPFPDGVPCTVVFTIYDAATGGTVIWTESQSVTTSGGIFAVLLGSTTPITDAVFTATTRYLGIKVGADPEMTPRVALVTVPYAFRISTVDGSTGGSISGDILLENSTATTGNIWKGGSPFIHAIGSDNTSIGKNAGNINMTGSRNTACGSGALASNSTGNRNTAAGNGALVANTTGSYNTAIGLSALVSNIGGSENTASGAHALLLNSTGTFNTASGFSALSGNTTGGGNTASGLSALSSNTTGDENTAIGAGADVASGDLNNATAVGAGAIVDASNKIRLGNSAVTVIEGQVAYTYTSDKSQKENFNPVDGEDVLRKIRQLNLTSWNYKNQDPRHFRHYGPVAQEFFAAFGRDSVGQSGTETTINSGDLAGITMIAVQALEKRTAELDEIKSDNSKLKAEIQELRALIQQLAAERRGK